MFNVEQTLKNMQSQIDTLIIAIARNKEYNSYDIEAGMVNTSKAQKTADDNTLTISKVNENIEVQDSVLQMMAEEILPEMSGQNADLSDLIDTILTEIIPNMLGEADEK